MATNQTSMKFAGCNLDVIKEYLSTLPLVLTIYGCTPSGRRISIDVPTEPLNLEKMRSGEVYTLGRHRIADYPICSSEDNRYPEIAVIIKKTDEGYCFHYGYICGQPAMTHRDNLLVTPNTPLDIRAKRIMTKKSMKAYIAEQGKTSPAAVGIEVCHFRLDSPPSVLRFYGSYDGIPCNVDIQLVEAGIIADLENLKEGDIYTFGREGKANFYLCSSQDWTYPSIAAFVIRGEEIFTVVNTYGRPEYLGCAPLRPDEHGGYLSYYRGSVKDPDGNELTVNTGIW